MLVVEILPDYTHSKIVTASMIKRDFSIMKWILRIPKPLFFKFTKLILLPIRQLDFDLNYFILYQYGKLYLWRAR